MVNAAQQTETTAVFVQSQADDRQTVMQPKLMSNMDVFLDKKSLEK